MKEHIIKVVTDGLSCGKECRFIGHNGDDYICWLYHATPLFSEEDDSGGIQIERCSACKNEFGNKWFNSNTTTED